ncbi:translation initiation factor eIF-2B subunit epsilon-like, partial [Trifolium medium]|nr:translation initiation factor eIF-2B subunit epsilon-like [Trifolium medium]
VLVGLVIFGQNVKEATRKSGGIQWRLLLKIKFWRHSVAPKAMEDELELILDGNSIDSDEDDNDDSRDKFDKEVEATFLRAVRKNIQENDLTIEVNFLKSKYNKIAADRAGALFYAMMKYAVDMPH